MARISSWRKAAVCLHSNGDADRARQLYQRVLDLDPRNAAAALYSMGGLAREGGSPDEAVILALQSLEFEPTAEKCIFIGDVLEQKGSHKAALVYYRKAKQMDPCGETALEALAQALDRHQEYEESSAVWARLLRLGNGASVRQFQLRIRLADALRLAGHLSPAGQVLSQARNMTSDSS